MYALLRPLLFSLSPETAHSVTLSALRLAHHLRLLALYAGAMNSPVELMGLKFNNRVGIAAGLDKNAICIDALAALGVGSVEVGTVTPRPQPGNPQPRIFRLTGAQAMINRMGFPNDGADVVAQRLARRTTRVVCGVNIGKNATTALEDATRDYVAAFRATASHADYITVNVSSPNTVGLRALQAADQLRPILEALLAERERLSLGRSLPLLVKIAPDLTPETLAAVAELLLELAIDGVIATNTTIQRPGVAHLGAVAEEKGGLSGLPLHDLSLATVRALRQQLGPTYPIIGVGGITTADQALAMRAAGADLVQIYTGLVYRGPRLVQELCRALHAGSTR